MNGYFLVGLEGGNIWNLLPAVNYLQDKVIITIVRDLTSLAKPDTPKVIVPASHMFWT